MPTSNPQQTTATRNSLKQAVVQAASRQVLLRLDAAGSLDAAGLALAPASLVVELSPCNRQTWGDRPRITLRVLAADRPEAIDPAGDFASAIRIALPETILLPGLVNAHTHLDLTGVGPRPFDPERPFAEWLAMVVNERPRTEEAIAAAVDRGVRLSLQAGVVAVGDIAGARGPALTGTPWARLHESPLYGVSFVESFGMGPTRAGSNGRSVGRHMADLLDRFPAGCEADAPARFGLSPHAPVSVDRRVYEELGELAAARGLLSCTHLSESPDEHRFIAAGVGPVRDLLEKMSLWDEQGPDGVGRGRTPIEHMAEILRRFPTIAVHVNDASDRDIEILAETKTPIVYCPRASSYFGFDRRLGPHRYREMHRAGVRVALGTDSLINLPEDCSTDSGQGVGSLGDLRLLYQRGDFGSTDRDLADLLSLATTEGAAVLGLDPSRCTLRPGSSPIGIVGVGVGHAGGEQSALARVFSGDSPPRLLLNGK